MTIETMPADKLEDALADGGRVITRSGMTSLIVLR